MERGGGITTDEDVFHFLTLDTSLPVTTLNVDENIGDLQFIYYEVAKQAFGLLPQQPISSEEFKTMIRRRPITFVSKISDSLPINSNNRNVLAFSDLVRSLTSRNECKAVVLSSKPNNVPSEIGRNLVNIPVPKKV